MKVKIRSNIVAGGSFDIPGDVSWFVSANGVWFESSSSESFFDPFRDCGFVIDSSDSAWRKIPWKNVDGDCWLRVEP